MIFLLFLLILAFMLFLYRLISTSGIMEKLVSRENRISKGSERESLENELENYKRARQRILV